jgi:hypothetical protein
MNKTLQSGSILTDEFAVWKIIGVYLGALAVMAGFYFGLDLVLRKCKVQWYMDAKKNDQLRMRGQAMANFHHVTVLIVGIVCLYTACGDNTEYPVKDSKAGIRWVDNAVCFMQPYIGFSFNICINLAYLTMDTISIGCIYEERNKTLVQTLYHHAMSIAGFTSALIAGYGMPGICSCSLLCEVSSLFLNYRQYFNK